MLMRSISGVVAGLLVAGCATTTTRLAPIAPEQIEAEEAAQRELVLRELNRAQQRLNNLAFPLLRAAVPLCSERVEPAHGFAVRNLSEFSGPWRLAAQSGLALSDTVVITAVTAGSPASRAGILPGDRLLSVNGVSIPPTRQAADVLQRQLDASGFDKLILELRRGAEQRRAEVTPEEACGFGTIVTVEGDINAFADGDNVILPWAMMRFANDDELRVVLSHEIAHNAMGHIEAKMRNAMWGALFGLVADVALATQGVNSGGQNTSDFMALAASAFSQDFEREADYVGMYIMALADLPLETAPEFWRQFAQINPNAISYASTHPTTAERFVRLRAAASEIDAKRQEGMPLRPEMKNDPE